MKAIVIGGGAAGMGAAWKLRKQGVEVVIVEKEPDLGGRCRTFFWEGAWRIRGAFAFVGSEKNLVEQAKELGVYNSDSVADLTENHAQYLLHHKHGIIRQDSLAPTDILKSSLLSWKEKASLTMMLPTLARQVPKNDPRDITSAVHLDTESAYDYINGISTNFADYILEPTMQMFCGYEKDDYSKAWLVWLMAGFAWAGDWWSFKDRGVGALSHAFEENFKKDSQVDLRLNTTVSKLDYSEDGVTAYVVQNGETVQIDADMAVLAVPAPLIPSMIPDLDEARRGFLASTGYVGHHIAYYLIESEEKELHRSLTLPSADGYRIISNLHFYPQGDNKYIVTGELKGQFCKDTLGHSEDDILDAAWEEFIRAEPRAKSAKFLNRYLQRNDLAICRREVGFVTRLKAFKDLPPLKRVAFAGDYMINSTVGQAHWSGLQAADALMARNS